MGTTINGVYEGGKRLRRVKALARLQQDLSYYQNRIKILSPQEADNTLVYLEYQIDRINKEIATLKSRI